MKATLQHIQLNVSNKNISYPFYKEMLLLLGYKIYSVEDWGIGMRDPKTNLVIWVAETENKFRKNKFHRKATGINHLAFLVSSKKNVDDFYKNFIKKNNIKTLYQTPKAFPEYTPNYYAVFFEDPDRIKLEVVFM
ncbi:hypothetical protein A3A69_01265 [candidate division WWE3 bacterium RIFCSPLOWO2_01_FULL_37_15]|uniref:Uncharacterized protein n=1 Tax=candidate division WWE3 bacterium RIFCSPLOWO2_01_FULL_37_15 TaxID=1802622 RepID=A0A1F4UT87_UNCKA|nr:MAG: hypothetical protein A3A69_01265 [candidate division WWE3 bacterium RIFCSPLOWO2_01_FULL_37_15]